MAIFFARTPLSERLEQAILIRKEAGFVPQCNLYLKTILMYNLDMWVSSVRSSKLSGASFFFAVLVKLRVS